jgi:predicted nucleotidyltransferase
MKTTDAYAIVSAVADWAVDHDAARAMALVGSWARGNPHQGSDIDLLLLSDCADEYRRSRKWLTEIDLDGAGYRVLSSEDKSYGVVWSRHIALLPAGEVELTLAPCSWARIDPVDAGTRTVVKDAFQIIFDKDGILANLLSAVMSEE